MKKIIFSIVFSLLIFLPINAYALDENIMVKEELFCDALDFKFQNGVDINCGWFDSNIGIWINQAEADLVTLGYDYYTISFSNNNFPTNYTTENKVNIVINYYSYLNIGDLDFTIKSAMYTAGQKALYYKPVLNDVNILKASRIFYYKNNTNPYVYSLTTSANAEISNQHNQYTNKSNFLSPLQFFFSTNIPDNILSSIDFTVVPYNSSSWVDKGVKINNDIYTVGQSFNISTYFDYIVDTEAPIITINGGNPYYHEIGQPYVDIMPTAIDNVDGDLSSYITVVNNMLIDKMGTYEIFYQVCDSSNNCSSKTKTVIVTDFLEEIDITNKSAILFYYKTFNGVQHFGDKFYYKGSFKYGVYNLNDDNIATNDYENYLPFYSEDLDYENYQLITMSCDIDPLKCEHYYTNNIPFGYVFYNVGGNNNAFIKYDTRYFNYVVYDNLYNNSEQVLDYIDYDGLDKNKITTRPPSTDIKYVEDFSIYSLKSISNSLTLFVAPIGYIFSLFSTFFLNLPMVVQAFLIILFGLGILKLIFMFLL